MASVVSGHLFGIILLAGSVSLQRRVVCVVLISNGFQGGSCNHFLFNNMYYHSPPSGNANEIKKS